MKQNKTRASRKSNVTFCMKNPYPILLLLPLLLLLGGCDSLIVKIYGFKTEYDPITPEQRAETLARFGLEGEPWHELDTAARVVPPQLLRRGLPQHELEHE